MQVEYMSDAKIKVTFKLDEEVKWADEEEVNKLFDEILSEMKAARNGCD